MAALLKVRGMRQAVAAVKKTQTDAEKHVERGLKRAGLFLQRSSQEIVPVDLGPLQNSAFTRATGRGVKTQVQVGYTMLYAMYVHEDMTATHKAGTTAKYLERPLREKRAQIAAIIKAG